MNIKGGKMVQYMFQWSPLGGGGGGWRNDKDEPRYKESKHTYLLWELNLEWLITMRTEDRQCTKG
jgi:hypothetical protein